MKPTEINKNNEKELLQNVFEYTPPEFIGKAKLKVSDRVEIANKRVRIANKKENFSGIRIIGLGKIL